MRVERGVFEERRQRAEDAICGLECDPSAVVKFVVVHLLEGGVECATGGGSGGGECKRQAQRGFVTWDEI